MPNAVAILAGRLRGARRGGARGPPPCPARDGCAVAAETELKKGELVNERSSLAAVAAQEAEFVILLKKELDCLAGAVDSPVRPICAIVGGAKVSTRIPVIESMLDKVDKLVIGGGMVLTFVKARGLSVGGSLVEEDMLHLAKKLPSDVACGDDFPADGKEVGFKVVPAIEIPDGWLGLDYGPDATEIKRPWLTASDLERPHGRVREPAVLQGHLRDCRVPGRDHGEGRCHHHHRRWRLRVGREQVGARSEDVAHLHGRRREPGAPGGQGVAGSCSAG